MTAGIGDVALERRKPIRYVRHVEIGALINPCIVEIFIGDKVPEVILDPLDTLQIVFR